MHVHVDSVYDTAKATADHARSRSKRYAAACLLGLARRVPYLRQALALRPKANATIRSPIRICLDCNFIGPSQIYPLHQLVGLYRDYRSDAYNQDRCAVEPSYEKIKDLVGKCQQEIDSRRNNLDDIIDCHVNCKAIQTVLDWGGGEGRFVPTSLANKSVTILDYSDEQLVDPSFVRVDALVEKQQFNYIQICHVLEHVSEPLSLMQEVISHLNPGGYIYIESPQDRSNSDLSNFISAPPKMYHFIHEHLNLYSESALAKLGASLGLRCLHLGSRDLDFGWCRGIVLSGLFVNDS